MLLPGYPRRHSSLWCSRVDRRLCRIGRACPRGQAKFRNSLHADLLSRV